MTNSVQAPHQFRTTLTKDTVRLGMALPQLSRQWDLQSFTDRHRLVYGPGRVMEEAWPERNIHSDVEAAKREGLAAPVVSAPQIFALVHRSMLMTFGVGWIAGGRLDLKMIAPVFPDDFTTLKGQIVSLMLDEDIDGNECVRATCKVSVEKLDGKACCVGTASALLQ